MIIGCLRLYFSGTFTSLEIPKPTCYQLVFLIFFCFVYIINDIHEPTCYHLRPYYQPHPNYFSPLLLTAMAVALTREGTDKTLPPANLKLPQVKVRNLPVLTPEHFQTGPVTGRTQTVYSCGSPGRDAFWKDNYER